MGKVFADAGLSARGGYAFGYMRGDVVKILEDDVHQAEALHHRCTEQGRKLHYSAGVRIIPISRIMMEELTEEQVQRLKPAGYYQRRLDGDAMAATLARGSKDGLRGAHVYNDPLLKAPNKDPQMIELYQQAHNRRSEEALFRLQHQAHQS